MERVSSVTAFVARYLTAPQKAEGEDLFAGLPPLERQALELLARVPGREQRRQHLAEQTGELWEVARYDRLEARALRHLEHALSQRGLLER